MAARRTSRAPGPPDVDALSPAPVHLLVGDDEYQRDTQARRLVERLCPESDRALGLEIIEGAELATLADVAGAVRRCLEAVQTMGFFGVQKVVWFRDMKFLTDKRLARSTGLKDALEPLAGQIRRGVPEGVRLVLSGPGIDRRSGLFRACAEGGHTLEFNLPEKTYQQEAQARERAQALFAQAGIRIAPEDLDLFLAKTGNDTRQIMQEVDKVRLFLGDRDEAVWSDLQVIVSPAKEASSWELQDAFGARDLAGALRAARELLFHGASPIGLILGLQARCRDLILLKGCLRPERGWCRLTGSDHYPQVAWADNPDREAFFSLVSPNLPATHPYRVARLARQAQLFGPELLHIQGQLVRAHQDMIEGSLPKELVLEMTLLRVLRPHP